MEKRIYDWFYKGELVFTGTAEEAIPKRRELRQFWIRKPHVEVESIKSNKE